VHRLETFGAQGVLHGIGDRRLVFDQEDSGHGRDRIRP
jgi:hypothetical protein